MNSPLSHSSPKNRQSMSWSNASAHTCANSKLPLKKDRFRFPAASAWPILKLGPRSRHLRNRSDVPMNSCTEPSAPAKDAALSQPPMRQTPAPPDLCSENPVASATEQDEAHLKPIPSHHRH